MRHGLRKSIGEALPTRGQAEQVAGTVECTDILHGTEQANARLKGEPGDLGLDLRAVLSVTCDIEPPPGKPRRQARKGLHQGDLVLLERQAAN